MEVDWNILVRNGWSPWVYKESALRREITQNKNQQPNNPLTQYTPREVWASSFEFTTKVHLCPLFKWEISARLVLRRDFGGVIAHKKISAQYRDEQSTIFWVSLRLLSWSFAKKTNFKHRY